MDITNLSKKENELKNSIQYHKENMDKLVQIEILEIELSKLKQNIKSKAEMIYKTKKLYNYEYKYENDCLTLCSTNCLEALNLYSKSYNKQLISLPFKNYVLGERQYNLVLEYKFSPIQEKRYNVECNIKSVMSDGSSGIMKRIIGIYSEKGGFEWGCPDNNELYIWPHNDSLYLRNSKNRIWLWEAGGKRGMWQGIYLPTENRIDYTAPEPTMR